MDFYNRFFKFIQSSHPSVWKSTEGAPLINFMFSPAVVSLPTPAFETMKSFAKEMYAISRSKTYQSLIGGALPTVAQRAIPHSAVFMSYDFHLTASGPKLIEINTNASLSSYGALISDFQTQCSPSVWEAYLQSVRTMFEQEADAAGLAKPLRIAIVDEAPEKQRAYPEFLILRDMFVQMGWSCEILDVKDLVWSQNTLMAANGKGPFNFVYNRHTDFYFETPDLAACKSAYESGSVCVTPNPREYGLLADKERIHSLSKSEFRAQLGLSPSTDALLDQVLLKTSDMKDFSLTSARSDLSRWFFKPRRSFGGKAVYKGSGISKKILAEILEKDYLAQEIAEPSITPLEFEGKTLEFKTDFRCYAYKDQIFLTIARLYQGQMTNTQTLGGGLAAVQLA